MVLYSGFPLSNPKRRSEASIEAQGNSTTSSLGVEQDNVLGIMMAIQVADQVATARVIPKACSYTRSSDSTVNPYSNIH
jgi:hypothetical protein